MKKLLIAASLAALIPAANANADGANPATDYCRQINATSTTEVCMPFSMDPDRPMPFVGIWLTSVGVSKATLTEVCETTIRHIQDAYKANHFAVIVRDQGANYEIADCWYSPDLAIHFNEPPPIGQDPAWDK
jgi:hypothetical protein